MNWVVNIGLILLWIVIATAAWAGWSAAPWVPSKNKHRKLFLDRMEIKPGDVVYDLGCGTGTVLFDIAQRQPEAKVVGVEISLLPYLIAKIKATRFENVTVRYGNLFKTDLSDADIVFVYLLKKAYPKLIKKFAPELKDDAIVAIEAWPIDGIKSFKTLEEKNVLPIFLYRGSAFR